MSKSRKKKKSWTCGHTGFGQFCHRCAIAASLELRLKEGTKIIWNEVVLKEDFIKSEIARLRS